MGLAILLEKICPNAKYSGSLTANNKEAWDNIQWLDSRDKPDWEAILQANAHALRPTDIWDKERKAWIDGRDFNETLASYVEQVKEKYNTKFFQELGKIYPAYEQATFETQLREAEAWNADQNSLTPFLDIYLDERSDIHSKADLVNDIMGKATRYSRLAARILGQQKSEIAILEACTTLTELDNLVSQ